MRPPGYTEGVAGAEESIRTDPRLAVADALLNAESPAAVADAVARALPAATGADRALLTTAPSPTTPVAHAAAAGAEVWLGSAADLLARYPAGAEDALASGAQAWVALPLVPPGAPGARRPRRPAALTLAFASAQRFDAEQQDRLRALARQVAVALHRAELLDGQRSAVRFADEQIGIFAHDLRSPLGAIALTADTLLSGQPDPSTQRRFLLIQRGTKRMERMLNQVVDFTRSQLGSGLTFTPTSGDLGALATTAAQEAGVRTGRKVEVSTMGSGRGAWDADRMPQAVANLIGNAAEHGDPSAPVRVDLDGTHPDRIVLAVWNAGAIDAEEAAAVFEPFRGGRSRGKTSGLGLGLHLARMIIEAHGGSIAVESGPGTGTTFTLQLPRG